MSHVRYTLDPCQYTYKNALLWGMSFAHLRQARHETTWRGKVFHVVLGASEILPVAGQIVSLIELGIIRFFKFDQSPLPTKQNFPAPTSSAPPKASVNPSVQVPLTPLPASTQAPHPGSHPPESNLRTPEPKSCIPTTSVSKLTDDDKGLPCYWPNSLNLLGLSKDQMNLINGVLSEAFAHGFQCNKKAIVVNQNSKPLPITIHPFENKSGVNLLLLSKVIFAAGGERRIRWAYNLTKGEFLIKKRMVGGEFEKQILSFMCQSREDRGIANPIYSFRTVKGKDGTEKLQVFEKIRNGTLCALFGTKTLLDFSTKTGIFTDLLQDLRTLHGINLSIQKTPQKVPSLYKGFHLDIKFENIVAFLENGKWRAELIDFGRVSSNLIAWGISVGFTSPEFIRFYMLKRPESLHKAVYNDDNDTSEWNQKYAQKRDIWAMGLVLLGVLVGRNEEATWIQSGIMRKVSIAPLPCLKTSISPSPLGYYREAGILNLTQGVLNADINALNEEARKTHPNESSDVDKYFNLVRRMLRINPDERPDIMDLFF